MPVDQTRDQWRSRLAYVEAVRRLNRAMNAWDGAGIEIDPRSPRVYAVWTPRQHEVMATAAQAWADVVAKKKEYESSLRARPSH